MTAMFEPVERESITEAELRQEESRQTQYVYLYGLSAEEAELVRKNLPSGQSKIAEAELASDLVACPSYAIIFRSSAMTTEEIEMMRGCFTEVPYFVEVPIVIGGEEFPASVRSRFRVYPDFDTLLPDVKYLLMAGLRKQKKNRTFYYSLSIAIEMLSMLRRCHDGFTTGELAERMGISTRSIQRFIETLRVAGEWIIYDAKTKHWRLEVAGKSALWGDLEGEDSEID